jgi:alpha-1,6-mannosyltransferase
MRAGLALRWMPRDATVVVYAGRLSPEKHVAVLPDVLGTLAARHPGLHLLVAGDGPSRDVLEQGCRAVAPGRSHFLGHVADRRALHEIVASADVFLHPNPREPFGIGPLEAMAAGTPVVLPATRGVLTYATSDNAWLTPGATPDALAGGVTAALEQPAERRRRADNARLTAAGFAWPRAASKIFTLYERLHAARLARQLTGIRPSRAPAQLAR